MSIRSVSQTLTRLTVGLISNYLQYIQDPNVDNRSDTLHVRDLPGRDRLNEHIYQLPYQSLHPKLITTYNGTSRIHLHTVVNPSQGLLQHTRWPSASKRSTGGFFGTSFNLSSGLSMSWSSVLILTVSLQVVCFGLGVVCLTVTSLSVMLYLNLLLWWAPWGHRCR